MQLLRNKMKTGLSLEHVVFLIYFFLHIMISAFHEPWFDESQSWQIARYASIYDIVFRIPHYEGHPQLWHLLLAPFAKSGMPFELGIKSIGLVVSTIVVYLIIFISPLPRLIRLLLPFNYFLFYQYGIMVRPYMLLILLMIVLAILFPCKNSQPEPFVAVLGLLCLTHAYGLAIAAGVALAFSIDIIREKGIRLFFAEIIRDSRTRSLIILLVIAVFVIYCIMPVPDTYNSALCPTTPLYKRLIYSFIGLQSESLAVTSPWFLDDRALLQTFDIPFLNLISSCFIGLIIWCSVFLLSTKRNFKYYWMPYCAFAFTGGMLYLAAHHVGVSLGILLFWLWVDLDDEQKFEHYWKICTAFKASNRDLRLLCILGSVVVIALISIPIWWTGISCWKEIDKTYDSGRDIALFIKSNNLHKGCIFKAWNSSILVDNNTSDVTEGINTCSLGDVSTVQAYFNELIISNVDTGYLEYRVPSKEENEEKRKKWYYLGKPDVLIGKVDLQWVFNDEVSMDDYGLVFIGKQTHIWKGQDNPSTVLVYLRKDLFEKTGLNEIILTPAESRRLTGEFQLTEEMKESLRTGETSMDELLDELGL